SADRPRASGRGVSRAGSRLFHARLWRGRHAGPRAERGTGRIRAVAGEGLWHRRCVVPGLKQDAPMATATASLDFDRFGRAPKVSAVPAPSTPELAALQACPVL